MRTSVKMLQFKSLSEVALFQCDIGVLRAYARRVGVEKPTTKKKMQLVNEIVAILLGEKTPIEQSKRGAPVKNSKADMDLIHEMEEIRRRCFGDEPVEFSSEQVKQVLSTKGDTLNAFDSEVDWENREDLDYYEGQLQTLGGVACLLPLSCKENESKNVVVPVDLIRRYDLREGDIIRCRMRKMEVSQGWVVIQVQSRNGIEITGEESKRMHFEQAEVCFPTKGISFYHKEEEGKVTCKAFEWLMPIRRGQRACIIADPKTGKTNILYELAKASLENNPNLITYALLIEQTPETIMRFRELLPSEQIVYTTYEDDVEKQVFTADFLLKRAIRQVESGHDVLLVVDSFNTLASAFNNTDESSGGKVLVGGLESKTVQYLKRFFGTARAFKKGSSLTIIGALSKETGNIADDILCGDLSKIANLEIHLSAELAVKRIYPAIDFKMTRFSENALTEEQYDLDNFMQNHFLPMHGNEAVVDVLRTSKTFQELQETVRNR